MVPGLNIYLAQATCKHSVIKSLVFCSQFIMKSLSTHNLDNEPYLNSLHYENTQKSRKHRLMSLVVLYEVIKTGENSTSEISTV